LETLTCLAVLIVGTILVVAVALKTLLGFLGISFWTLTLQSRVLVGLIAGTFAIFLTIVMPIVIVVSVVNLSITFSTLVITATPFILIAFGICFFVIVFFEA